MKKQKFPRLVVLFARMLMSGHGIVDLRGKVQGSVTQKSRYGMVMRVKVTPVNPRTQFQQTVRSLLAYFSSKFRSLGPTVIAGWNSAAQNGFITKNIFGNDVKQTGHGLYVGLNLNLTAAEQPEITNAPTPEGVANPVNIDPSGVSSTQLRLNATFQGATDVVPADTAIIVMATPKLSGGQTFTKGKFRIIQVLQAADDTGTVDLSASYNSRFGAPATGDRLAIQAVAVNINTGEAGIPMSQIITLT